MPDLPQAPGTCVLILFPLQTPLWVGVSPPGLSCGLEELALFLKAYSSYQEIGDCIAICDYCENSSEWEMH